MGMAIERYELPYSESAVDDLRERLERTRWPDEIPGSGWERGVDLTYLREICTYWRERFDWKAQIEKLAAWEHYRYVCLLYTSLLGREAGLQIHRHQDPAR